MENSQDGENIEESIIGNIEKHQSKWNIRENIKECMENFQEGENIEESIVGNIGRHPNKWSTKGITKENIKEN